MKRFKIIPMAFLLSLFAISLLNVNLTLAGYETDPTGDAGGNGMIDITRIDVEVSYHSHPEDDDVILKITLADELIFDENTSGIIYAYHFWVDTDLSTNSNTSEITTADYEYHASLLINWASGQWHYHSYIFASRYYYTGDGQGKTNGAFYWNKNTDSWQGTDPDLAVAVISGNTVSWDVTGVIFRQQPIGTGYLIQGAVSTNYNLNTGKDYAKESGWVGEFTNLCEYPSSTPSGTPSLPFPGFGFLVSFMTIGLVASSAYIFYKRKK
ncbi:MAG: hypothetical protein ACTSUW_01630 [Candidatus Heimdallarchaeota archaeon]